MSHIFAFFLQKSVDLLQRFAKLLQIIVDSHSCAADELIVKDRSDSKRLQNLEMGEGIIDILYPLLG